jgi:hypothetical protein
VRRVLNWSQNGQPVSDLADYSFTSTASRVLMANFIAQPSLVSALAHHLVTRRRQ